MAGIYRTLSVPGSCNIGRLYQWKLIACSVVFAEAASHNIFESKSNILILTRRS